MIESTLEDPRQIISAQRFKARGEAVAEMKSEGIEYDERIELLDEVTHPQPLAELLEAAYETYRKGHPWVADHPLRPKSIVRDMYERAMTFVEYVGFYGLARSEGLVLRYLTDAYRALRHTVPESARNDELDDLVEWLGELARQVDSSLLDEWEKLAAGDDIDRADLVRPRWTPSSARSPATRAPSGCWCATRCSDGSSSPPATTGPRSASSTATPAGTPTPGRKPWRRTGTSTTTLLTDADARGPGLLIVDDTTEPGVWRVRQILHDPEGFHDWALLATVDLAASDEAGYAVVRLVDITGADRVRLATFNVLHGRSLGGRPGG